MKTKKQKQDPELLKTIATLEKIETNFAVLIKAFKDILNALKD